MILSAIAAGASLANGIYGMFKSADAAKEQKNLLKQQEAKNNAWYERNYYQNYLDSSESKAAIKRVEDTMRRRNQEAQATAAVIGGTQEGVLAQQANDQQLMSDTVANLAARSDAKKEQVDAVNNQNQQNIMGQRIGQSATSESGAAQMGANGLGLIGQALQGVNWGKSGKSSETNSTSTPVAKTGIPTLEDTIKRNNLA